MASRGIHTLDELSALTGMNKGTLSKYFRGLQRPTITVIPPLCEALRVSPEELLRGLGIIAVEPPQK
jgi:transcriptional regulator with XRE-family HTH domain